MNSFLVAGVSLAVAVSPWARRRYVTRSATPGEAGGTLLGDDLLPDAGLVSTRAVTIGAGPCAVWPWLVQMGSGRGGAYTYDWIENLFGLNMQALYDMVLAPASLIMERRMLHGIRQRAEGLSALPGRVTAT